jgi:hypothetical protein
MRPMLHVDACRSYIAETYPEAYAIIWYETKTKHSAGMELFKTKKKAEEWNLLNPPAPIEGEGEFDAAMIVHPKKKVKR